MHSLKHPLSPKTPTAASTKMLERALSSRLASSYADDAFSDSDVSPISADESESKNKKQSLSLLIANHLSRLSHLYPCPTPCLILCLLLSFGSIASLLIHSRNFVCISPFDPATRVGFFGFDGLESDFGALGVPWCKDFVDFGSIDWKNVMEKHGVTDRSRVLIFFYDHQNELKRVKLALNAGFRHLVFEDNYDTGTGDHYSLRQICDQLYIRGGGHSCFRDSDESRLRSRRKKFWEKAVDIDELCGPDKAWWGVRGWMRDNFNHSNKPISYEEHFQNSRYIESILDVYWELPPVAGPSLTHQTRYDPARTTVPIVEDGRYKLFQRLGLGRLETSVFNGYTQMVYLQISEQES